MAFDQDCKAVVTTPLACQAWKRNRYDGLGDLGYSPQVGMAQGNVDSTDKWAATFDPLLCALDMVDEGHFYYKSEGGDSRPAEDTAVSFAGTHRALQAKADIVSGFCLIFGKEVAVKKKLRCFDLSWGNGERDAPDHILIHLQGWAPHPVPLQQDGLMKHLSVRWDMSVDNDTQKRMAEEQLTAALTRIVTMPCTMDLKRGGGY